MTEAELAKMKAELEQTSEWVTSLRERTHDHANVIADTVAKSMLHRQTLDQLAALVNDQETRIRLVEDFANSFRGSLKIIVALMTFLSAITATLVAKLIWSM